MALSRVQLDLHAHLQNAVNNAEANEFVYHTEWLGYLPFGLYHWIMVDGIDVSRSMPSHWASEWCGQDLDALESAGYIEMMTKYENPADEFETATTYKLL